MTRRVVLASVAAALLIASTASAAPGPPKVAARPGLPQVVSVKVLPTNHLLKRGTLNTVVVKPGLAFKVTIRNESDAPRTVRVRLIVGRALSSLGPIVKVATLISRPVSGERRRSGISGQWRSP